MEVLNSNQTTPAKQRRSSSVPANSRYIPNSEIPPKNPQVYQSFFHNDPLGKFNQDIKKYKPIAFKCPNSSLLRRRFVVVEERITRGKPLTAEQFQKIMSKKMIQPEIVTYGQAGQIIKQSRVGVRQTMEIKKEGARAGLCNCWSSAQNKDDIMVGKI